LFSPVILGDVAGMFRKIVLALLFVSGAALLL
jgi:hypothetical protein